jgi:2-polyprenyl-3-methyl-5-hydroxy-6-metoxy-1,4-benzoquinol methylase
MSKIKHLVMPKDHMDQLYNSANPAVRLVHRQRLSAIASELPGAASLRVLDAGCGEGHLLQKLHSKYPANRYFGVDITAVALEKAQQRCPFAMLYRMNLSDLAFADEAFDVVIITEVLEHIIEFEDVTAELLRVIRKGGRFIITFPNEVLWTLSRFLLGRRPIRVPDHINAFSPPMIQTMFGLELLRQRSLPFPLPFSLSLGCLMNFRK